MDSKKEVGIREGYGNPDRLGGIGKDARGARDFYVQPWAAVASFFLSCCAVSKYEVLLWTSGTFLWDAGTFFLEHPTFRSVFYKIWSGYWPLYEKLPTTTKKQLSYSR